MYDCVYSRRICVCCVSTSVSVCSFFYVYEWTNIGQRCNYARSLNSMVTSTRNSTHTHKIAHTHTQLALEWTTIEWILNQSALLRCDLRESDSRWAESGENRRRKRHLVVALTSMLECRWNYVLNASSWFHDRYRHVQLASLHNCAAMRCDRVEQIKIRIDVM